MLGPKHVKNEISATAHARVCHLFFWTKSGNLERATKQSEIWTETNEQVQYLD